MMDLLLDINIVIDYCAPRVRWHGQAKESLEQCAAIGGRIWLYAGSVQTLLYNLYNELKQSRPNLSNRQCMQLAKHRLTYFARDKHWLAALAGEGNVFDSEDPEDEQLLRALGRFASGTIALLTRDTLLLNLNDPRILTPEQYCQLPTGNRKIDFIDLKTQQDTLRPQLEKNIHRVLHHGQYIMGPEIKELEAKLTEYVGVKHAITAASGTDSLEIALRALCIGPGDEVITVPFTWISTAEVIVQVGARPVFIDIDPVTYNMNVDLLEASITPKTKAILPVSLFGQMPDYDRINAIAAKFNLPVIEDAAQSFGATQRGRRSCGVTLIGSTSFFPAKPFGCYGDGGALFTNDDQLAERMRAIRTHGGLQRHHHPYIGMNGRFDTLQAAILLAKLPSFDWEVQRRQEIGARYTSIINKAFSPELSTHSSVLTPHIEVSNTSVYAQYTIRVQNRDALAALLKQQGIPAAIYYPKCLHEQSAFDFCGYKWGDFPEAEKASREVLSLPMHPFLNEADQDRVVAAFRSVLTG